CDPAHAILYLPKNQTALVRPSTAPLFVMLGVGVQNYTCNSTTSTYSSIGAVASLFDIACLAHTAEFARIQTTAFHLWSEAPKKTSAESIGASRPAACALLGYHYFVPASSGTGLSPKWDFTSTGRFAGNSTAYVIGAKVGDLLAPANPAVNVDWLALTNTGGALASKIFRVDTVSGQPPKSCAPGSASISVKYTAKYYLY
ncbi:hypothetical protein C8R46DRAFT_835700, partial [Mycena filopes]